RAGDAAVRETRGGAGGGAAEAARVAGVCAAGEAGERHPRRGAASGTASGGRKPPGGAVGSGGLRPPLTRRARSPGVWARGSWLVRANANLRATFPNGSSYGRRGAGPRGDRFPFSEGRCVAQFSLKSNFWAA